MYHDSANKTKGATIGRERHEDVGWGRLNSFCQLEFFLDFFFLDKRGRYPKGEVRWKAGRVWFGLKCRESLLKRVDQSSQSTQKHIPPPPQERRGVVNFSECLLLSLSCERTVRMSNQFAFEISTLTELNGEFYRRGYSEGAHVFLLQDISRLCLDLDGVELVEKVARKEDV